MTNKEAHEYMENEIRCIQRSKICDRDCAKCELVKEDKPLIEAYGVAVLALEKQIPKKPTSHIVLPFEAPINVGHVRWQKWITVYKCPNCKEWVSKSYKHCPDCGQALDWSDSE